MPQQLSPLISYASGSAGATVAARNPYGPYLRNRTTPTDPNTALQQSARRRWARVADRWRRVLSAEQRAAWNAYAAQLRLPSRRVREQVLNGQQLFQRFNYARFDTALGIINNAPTIKLMPPAVAAVGNNLAGAGVGLYSFDNTGEWATEDGAALLLYISKPFNPGVRFCKGPFRFAEAKYGNSGGPPASPDPFIDPWGTPGTSNRWAKTRITRADGRCSSVLITPFSTNT